MNVDEFRSLSTTQCCIHDRKDSIILMAELAKNLIEKLQANLDFTELWQQSVIFKAAGD